MNESPPRDPPRDPLLDLLAETWVRHDPAPEGLTDRMLRAVHAELASDPIDVEYELLVLTSSSEQLVGARAAGTGQLMLQFDADELQLLVQVRRVSDTECRVDGWVSPAGELVVTAIQGGRRTQAVVSAPGRFEFPALGREQTRLILSTSADERDGTRFATSAFDL